MKLKVFGILSILFAICKYIECENLRQPASIPSLFCSDLNPQNDIDIEQMLGMWFGSEIISHHENMVQGEMVLDTCVTIHLSDITHEMATSQNRRQDTYFQQYHDRQIRPYELNNQRPYGSQFIHHLKMLWQEQDVNLEYTLRFNTSKRGFWISTAPQKFTSVKLNYGQFTGTIQVMKAVGTHIVLTFCENLPSNQLFSIVLSRRPDTLSVDDLQSVHSLLNRRGLSTVSIRRVCNGSTSMYSMPFLSLIATAIITLLLKHI